MFKHTQTPDKEMGKVDDKKVEADVSSIASSSDKNKSASAAGQDTSSLKELVEKNLKWSQIIYEQNRKINSKLMWMAIASWLKLFIILVPIILAALFLPPVLKDVWSQYGQLLGVNTSESAQQTKWVDTIINFSNLDPAKQEQLKALLK